jgi:hypothetical protein
MKGKFTQQQSKRSGRDVARPKGKPFPHGGRYSPGTAKRTK